MAKNSKSQEASLLISTQFTRKAAKLDFKYFKHAKEQLVTKPKYNKQITIYNLQWPEIQEQ